MNSFYDYRMGQDQWRYELIPLTIRSCDDCAMGKWLHEEMKRTKKKISQFTDKQLDEKYARLLEDDANNSCDKCKTGKHQTLNGSPHQVAQDLASTNDAELEAFPRATQIWTTSIPYAIPE